MQNSNIVWEFVEEARNQRCFLSGRNGPWAVAQTPIRGGREIGMSGILGFGITSVNSDKNSNNNTRTLPSLNLLFCLKLVPDLHLAGYFSSSSPLTHHQELFPTIFQLPITLHHIARLIFLHNIYSHLNLFHSISVYLLMSISPVVANV